LLCKSRYCLSYPSEAIAHLNLGTIYNEQKPEIAYNHFKRSIELTELIGGKIIEEEHKMDFYASHASSFDAYQLMIPVCLRLGKDKEAFEFAERSKSKTFLYLLASSNIRPSVSMVTSELKSLLDDEEKYLMKLRQIQTRSMIGSRSTTGLTVNVRDAIAVSADRYGVEASDYILSELNRIYDKIEPIDPEYVFLRRGRPLPLDKIQNILLQKGNNNDNATILIEYFIAKDKTYIFVISPQEFHIKTIELSSEKLTCYIQNYWREVVNYPVFKGIGSTWLGLSQYLIEPISEYLSHAHLIYFVPHGLLHYIPIHALELDGDPLIKNHAVAYSPSASLLQFYKNEGSGFLKTCASFGIVFKKESEEVAKLFDTEQSCSSFFLDAAKNTVVENIDRDILHFSCHGYFNNTDPLSSGIKLQDGILTAREIFDLRLNSELVTLSACETGLNESKPGDELIGLTRSIIYAGAASVIVSLWSVYDPSTRELMIEFYKELKDGKSKATALQQAQIKIMQKEEYSHRYFWAPFVLVGDWE
jgi:CHAT domain-containing protein